MSKITYTDKEYIYENTSIPAINKITDDDMNEIKSVVNEIDTNVSAGWISSNETWTYASVDNPTGVITISGDKTSKYSLGMKIKFKNAANVIYGFITKINYSSTNTTLTFLHEINPSTNQALYLMANSAITENYYSTVKSPYGFPSSPTKWTIKYTDTNERNIGNPTQNVWYNMSLSYYFPIGIWSGTLSIYALATRGSAGNVSEFITISTANNTQSDSTLTLSMAVAPTTLVATNLVKKFSISLAEKKLMYINARTTDSSLTTIRLKNDQSALVLELTCAYL